MTESQLNDFKAWFNHSNWKPTDQPGEIGALMLNQMPKLFEKLDELPQMYQAMDHLQEKIRKQDLEIQGRKRHQEFLKVELIRREQTCGHRFLAISFLLCTNLASLAYIALL